MIQSKLGDKVSVDTLPDRQFIDERLWNPPGVIVTFYGTAPKGWLSCDGTAKKIRSYFNLYRALKNGGFTPLGDSDGIYFSVPTVTNGIIKV